MPTRLLATSGQRAQYIRQYGDVRDPEVGSDREDGFDDFLSHFHPPLTHRSYPRLIFVQINERKDRAVHRFRIGSRCADTRDLECSIISVELATKKEWERAMTNRECIAQASNLSRSRSPKRHNFVMKLQQFKNNQSLALVVRYLGFALYLMFLAAILI